MEQPDNKIDLSNHTILPGLTDSHVHLAISGTLDPVIRKKQVNDEYIDAKKRIEKHLVDFIKHGVTAVRDGGDHKGHVFYYKAKTHGEDEEKIIVKTPKTAWHAAGRYGKLLGRTPDYGTDLSRAIFNSHEAGIDHIKIINSGINSLKTFGKETPPHFNIDELKRAVNVGNDLGLKTMVHANGYEPVQIALESGCHSIEHGFFMGDENLKRMAETGVVWVPTICTMKAYMEYLSDGILEYDVAKRNLYHQIEQVKKAIEYGVTIALGTDSGSPGVYHGLSVIDEMKLLMEAGLSREKAVQCGTLNAFKLSNNGDMGGKIITGMPATFLAAKGGPENLPESLHNVGEVWIRGKKLSEF